jgi:hypothetical protein
VQAERGGFPVAVGEVFQCLAEPGFVAGCGALGRRIFAGD